MVKSQNTFKRVSHNGHGDHMLNLRRLKASRNELGLTRTALAEKIGISPAHYSQIERGDAGVSMETFEALLKALNVSVIDLWVDADGNSIKWPSEVAIEKDDGQTKVKYSLPLTEETYKFLAAETDLKHFEERLKAIVAMWAKLDEEEKDKLLHCVERLGEQTKIQP